MSFILERYCCGEWIHFGLFGDSFATEEEAQQAASTSLGIHPNVPVRVTKGDKR